MAVMLRTLADLRRVMRPGVEFDVISHVYPALSGRRRVVKVTSKAWCLSFPPGHPRAGGDHNGSWIDIPLARACTFNGDSVTINDSGRPFITLTPTEDASWSST